MKKILIIRLSSLGDVLLAAPLIRAVRNTYPDAALDFCVRTEYADAVRYNPNITNLFEFPRSQQDISALTEKLSNHNYDLIIDLQNNRRSKRLISGSRAEIRSFRKRSIDKFLLVHFKINRLTDAPPIPKRYADSAEIKMSDDTGLEFYFPSGYQRKQLPDNCITLCPGARHYTKRYPIDYFIETGNELVREGYCVIITGGSADKDIAGHVAAGIKGSLNMTNDNDLFLTADILSQSLAVLCNDSGLMHLACAVHTPAAVIFGSTVKEFGFTPYGNRNIILENNSLSCRPCSHIGRSRCPKKHFKCMNDLKPDFILQGLRKLLSAHE
jgi:heptosyltransferase-2